MLPYAEGPSFEPSYPAAVAGTEGVVGAIVPSRAGQWLAAAEVILSLLSLVVAVGWNLVKVRPISQMARRGLKAPSSYGVVLATLVLGKGNHVG